MAVGHLAALHCDHVADGELLEQRQVSASALRAAAGDRVADFHGAVSFNY